MRYFYSIFAILFLYSFPKEIVWLVNKIGLKMTKDDIPHLIKELNPFKDEA